MDNQNNNKPFIPPAPPKMHKVSEFGRGVEYKKAADHLHERLVCLGFEFRETQFGEGYNMLCADTDGVVCRFTGKHSRIIDRLKFVIRTNENCPFQFIFVNAGTPAKPVYDVEDWDNG